jgi:hypothetical protein
MRSLFGRLFGRGASGPALQPSGETVDYKGYRIRAAPFQAEGQFQTAGSIEKDFADGRKEHRFIRAEKHTSMELAVDFSVLKARQIIDERGDRIFDQA